jgi:hypothetical protein
MKPSDIEYKHMTEEQK